MLDTLWESPEDEIVVPVDSADRRMNVQMIDSPGLDDSDGNDFANIMKVLTLLNEMHARSEGQARLNTIVFIISIQTPFAAGLGRMLTYYQKCIPSLFTSIIIINTNFTVKFWDQELAKEHREHKLSRHQADDVCAKLLNNRRQKFKETFKLDLIHFLLDSKPEIDDTTEEISAFEELMSRNAVSRILKTISGCKGMPINIRTPYKLDQMVLVDDRISRRLNGIRYNWEERRKILEN